MINQKCPLVLRDLYSYDVVSAFPSIMQMQDYDFGDVDLSNKEERNRFIGKQQIGNKNLSDFLNDSVRDLTDFYLQYNEIEDDDVVFRQKDGFILRKMLAKNDTYMEMKLRSIIDLLIIDPTRQKLLYFDQSGGCYVKGVRYNYDALNTVYRRFYDLDFYNKKTLCLQLESIKQDVVHNPDKLFYGINGDDGQYIFMLKNGKTIRTRDPDFVDNNLIDTRRYFTVYFKPFVDSVFVEEFYGSK